MRKALSDKTILALKPKTIAQSDPDLQASMDEIDAREFLIGTPTNVFNIEKHKFVTPRSGTYVTRRTTVDPDFSRDCLRFKRFLDQICEGDQKVIAYIRRWCGYVLTGSTKEQALLVVYGPGGNGKSVLVNTLATIMGDYHKEAAAETFVETKAFRHETALAHVAGARFVTSGETDQDGGWNEATMKRAVGGDPVTARFLYRNPFTYRPCYKIWVTTNHLPRLKSVGPAMRRRIHVLELNYVPKRPDPDLEEKLAREHAAILAWMVAHHVGIEVHARSPRVSAELPEGGERFEGLLPPVVAAPAFAIRKPAVAVFTLDDYAATGIMSPVAAESLRHGVESRANILVGGGTGSGKTTLVNALLAEVAKTTDRIVLIEDTRELQRGSCLARRG